MASKILLKIFLAVLLLKLCNGNGISVTTTISTKGNNLEETSSPENSYEMNIEASSIEDLKKILDDDVKLYAFFEKHIVGLTENIGEGTCGEDIAPPLHGITPEKMMDESFYAIGFENWTLPKVITSEQHTLSCKNDTLLNIHQACYCGSCCSGYCGCPEITKVMSKICNLNQSCNMNVSDIVNTLEQYADCQINVSYTCIKKGSLAGEQLIKNDWYQASNKYWYQYDEKTKKKFPEAKNACILSGGRLASVGIRDNNTKWQLVHKYEWKQKDDPRIRWVGLEEIKNMCWKWNDGTLMKDELWKKDEPNNKGGDEDCGYTDANHNWMMSDGECSKLGLYVCETPCDVSYQGRCFRIEKSKLKPTFESACSSFGKRWQLAIVSNETQLNLLKNYMRDQISSNSTESISLWLGMTVSKEVRSFKIAHLLPGMLNPNDLKYDWRMAVSTERCLNVTKTSDKLDGSICEYIGPPASK